MKKLEIRDPAQTEASIRDIRAIFPEAWTEDGIDFEVLKQLLGGVVEERQERYGLNWNGKLRARQLALPTSSATLRPSIPASVDWVTTEHLLIDGDNLEVLKLLQKSYARRAKLIYLDPPYNTGKDFVYHDNFRDNLDNYKALTGQLEGGSQRSSRAEAGGRVHTDWLNMMYPRLKLARNLLRNDGVLLVSINDIEAPHVRLLLNELFGEENFLCQFVWNNDGNVDQQSKIKGVHEYIIAYVRNLEAFTAPTAIDPNIEESSKLFNERIENSITKNGPANPPSTVQLPAGFPAAFETGAIPVRDDEWPHVLDELVVENGRLTRPGRVTSGWSSRNLLELFIRNGCIPIVDAGGKSTWFALTATGAIYVYKRRSEEQGHVLSVLRNVGTTKQNSNMLAAWGIQFSYPKPVYLLEWLIRVFTQSRESDLVIDLFAGSGTTGHAVYRLNARDSGNRRFLLVQLPEPLDAPSGSLCTLSDLTAERLRKSGMVVHEENPMFAGDLGFRRFELDSSNLMHWNPHPDDLEQALLDAVLSVKPNRTANDLLAELSLLRGIDLSARIDERASGAHVIHRIATDGLFACLSESIGNDEIEAIAQRILSWRAEEPTGKEDVCFFRDSAFADDMARSNLAAILHQHGLLRVESV